MACLARSSSASAANKASRLAFSSSFACFCRLQFGHRDQHEGLPTLNVALILPSLVLFLLSVFGFPRLSGFRCILLFLQFFQKLQLLLLRELLSICLQNSLLKGSRCKYLENPAALLKLVGLGTSSEAGCLSIANRCGPKVIRYALRPTVLPDHLRCRDHLG